MSSPLPFHVNHVKSVAMLYGIGTMVPLTSVPARLLIFYYLSRDVKPSVGDLSLLAIAILLDLSQGLR